MLQVKNTIKKVIPKIVSIHLERFPIFFLTTLGPSFLRTFYKAFLKNPSVLLVLEDDGEIKGFAAGSRDNRGFFKKLLLNNISEFVFSGIQILITKTSALKK